MFIVELNVISAKLLGNHCRDFFAPVMLNGAATLYESGKPVAAGTKDFALEGTGTRPGCALKFRVGR